MDESAAEPAAVLVLAYWTERDGRMVVRVTRTLDVRARAAATSYAGSRTEVMEQVTAPVRAPEPVDTTDYAAAVARPATPVSSDDAALQAVIDQPFAQWQVFLHPTQRRLVERTFNGPAKVSGGPGTGKTIVALHRARHLAAQLPAGEDRRVLLTSFNRNLAAQLRALLLDLAGPKIAASPDKCVLAFVP